VIGDRRMKRSDSTSITLMALSLRATRIARHSWVNSSITLSIRYLRPSLQEWIWAVGTKTAYIERGSPLENGYIESFNARLRDEILNGEIFHSLREAQMVIESWRRLPPKIVEVLNRIGDSSVYRTVCWIFL
jgi:transposase InsO family protein